jgi:hypothetical protein
VNELNTKIYLYVFAWFTVQHISYVASSLCVPTQMCYYNSQLLYELLQDHIFQCIPQILSFPDHLSVSTVSLKSKYHFFFFLNITVICNSI